MVQISSSCTKLSGYDIRVYFTERGEEGREWLTTLPAETAYYYSAIQKLCEKHGLRFSTCYIGNDARGESFYRYQHLWSNRNDCCDAVGNIKAFQTTCASVPHVAVHGTARYASSDNQEAQSQTVWSTPSHMTSR